MAIAYQSQNRHGGSSASNTIIAPGRTAGYVVVGYAIVVTTDGSSNAIINVPSGWTSLGTFTSFNSGTGVYIFTLLFYRVLNGSEFNVTFTGTAGYVSNIAMVAFTGVDNTNPIAVVANTSDTSGAAPIIPGHAAVAPYNNFVVGLALGTLSSDSAEFFNTASPYGSNRFTIGGGPGAEGDFQNVGTTAIASSTWEIVVFGPPTHYASTSSNLFLLNPPETIYGNIPVVVNPAGTLVEKFVASGGINFNLKSAGNLLQKFGFSGGLSINLDRAGVLRNFNPFTGNINIIAGIAGGLHAAARVFLGGLRIGIRTLGTVNALFVDPKTFGLVYNVYDANSLTRVGIFSLDPLGNLTLDGPLDLLVATEAQLNILTNTVTGALTGNLNLEGGNKISQASIANLLDNFKVSGYIIIRAGN